MMRRAVIMVFLLQLLLPGPVFAGMEDDPLLFAGFADEFEWRDANEGDLLVWDFEGWIGKDLDKFRWKTEGETINGQVEVAELQLLYSRAISTYWDFNIGWRTDFEPASGRDWAVLGLQGLAPYFFKLDGALFFGNSGQVAVRLQAEYDFMFTQKLILSPELEINAYSKHDATNGIGSGFSNLELALRLRYEIRREFAPYVGINWEKKFGNTADFSRNRGKQTTDTQLVIGIRAWF